MIPKEIENLFSRNAIILGRDYFDDDRVENLVIKDNKISAVVAGSRDYTVNLEISKKKIIHQCSCNNRDILCKHCAAVAFKAFSMNENVFGNFYNDNNFHTDKDYISSLFKQADEQSLKNFLFEALYEDERLFHKFKVFIKGQENVDSGTTIDEIRDSVSDTFENLDFSDIERLYEDYDDPLRYGYVEEWEMLRDGAEMEVQDYLDNIFGEADDALKVNDIIKAVKYLLGIYEGISIADLTNIDDEYCIFDGMLYDELLAMFKGNYKKFIDKVSEMQISDKAAHIVIDMFFERYSIYMTGNHSSFRYDLKLFNDFLKNFTKKPKTAKHLLQYLKQNDVAESDIAETLLAIYNVTGEREKWINVAEKYCDQYYQLAKDLLQYHENDKSNFIRIARKVAFNWEGKLLPYLYETLNVEDDYSLYKKVSKKMCKTYKSVDYYAKLKKDFGRKTAESFIQEVRRNNNNLYYVKLLEYEEKYEEILNFVKNNPHDWSDIIKPILKVYPEECFNIISERIDKRIEEIKGRSNYAYSAKLIKLIFSIDDKWGNIFVDKMLRKYNKRTAMKDEFRKAGLF